MNRSSKFLAALCAGVCAAASTQAQDASTGDRADPGVKLPQVLNIVQQHKKKLEDAKAREAISGDLDANIRAGARSPAISRMEPAGGQSGGAVPMMSTSAAPTGATAPTAPRAAAAAPAPSAASVQIPVAPASKSAPALASADGQANKPARGQGDTPSVPVAPMVPASVLKHNVPPSIDSKAGRAAAVAQHGGGAGAGMDMTVNDNPVLTMKPGVNQIIPIAVNHPNRIVTPFASPEVVSTSLTAGKEGECGEICIKDNVVYVATDKQVPVTMFITNKGSESQALSLTMLPKRVPPREVFLKLDGTGAASAMFVGVGSGNAKAAAWEKSQPYIETLRTAFRKLALNEIPQGYTMTQIPRELLPQAPRCAQSGMPVDFSQGQYLAGHNINIFVGVATNRTNQPQEFKEALCGNWDVAAVTSWPLKVLEPGQRTEVYVAVKQGARVPTTSQRPSLIGGR